MSTEPNDVAKAKEIELQKEKAARRLEGQQAYEQGLSPEVLRTDPPLFVPNEFGAQGYAEPSSNIDRLVGYLEAFRGEYDI